MKTQKQSKKEEARDMKRIKICVERYQIPNATKSVLTKPILGQMNRHKMVFHSVIHTTRVKTRIKWIKNKFAENRMPCNKTIALNSASILSKQDIKQPAVTTSGFTSDQITCQIPSWKHKIVWLSTLQNRTK